MSIPENTPAHEGAAPQDGTEAESQPAGDPTFDSPVTSEHQGFANQSWDASQAPESAHAPAQLQGDWSNQAFAPGPAQSGAVPAAQQPGFSQPAFQQVPAQQAPFQHQPAQNWDGSQPTAVASDGQTPVIPTQNLPAGGQALAGPFTIRDLVLGAGLVLILIGAIVRFVDAAPAFSYGYALPFDYWIAQFLLPLALLAVLATIRLNPAFKPRIGSFSIDQVLTVFVVYQILFLLSGLFGLGGGRVPGFFWWLLIGTVVLIPVTLVAHYIPVFKADFTGREEVVAHPVARNPIPATRAVKAAPAQAFAPAQSGYGHQSQAAPAPQAYGQPGYENLPGQGQNQPEQWNNQFQSTPQNSVPGFVEESPIDATVVQSYGTPNPAHQQSNTTNPSGSAFADPQVSAQGWTAPQPSGHDGGAAAQESAPAAAAVENSGDAAEVVSGSEAAYQGAFWFAVPEPRVVVHESTGAPLFTLQPGGWVLALQDNLTFYVVQDAAGNIGLLHDLRDVERGS